jgi:hypothetical protein
MRMLGMYRFSNAISMNVYIMKYILMCVLVIITNMIRLWVFLCGLALSMGNTRESLACQDCTGPYGLSLPARPGSWANQPACGRFAGEQLPSEFITDSSFLCPSHAGKADTGAMEGLEP